MTKIDIVSGFLGAGKTTLIKKMLQEAFVGEQVVLVENEFGEIGIDGGFLQDAGIEIKEMNSGCICCSLVGDFETSLKEVLHTYTPDRIIIEPSGVGKLSDVMKAVKNADLGEGVELNSAIAVVDATKCKMYIKNFGEFFVNQVEHAGTVILSRTGKISEEKLKEAVSLLREHNTDATIITTPWEDISGKQILETVEGATDLVAELMAEVNRMHEHHHDHDEEHECCHGHHDHDHDEEHECCHGHHDHEHDEEHECCHGHHDHDHDEEHECCHGHHDHDHDEEHECCHGHHDHEHDEEHECCHGHHEHEHDHGPDCTCGCHDHHHHHADEVFGSFGLETAAKYSSEDIENILKELEKEDKYGFVLRAKGMVPSPDGSWVYFDYVPEESNVRAGQPQPTGRFCVIGSKLQEENLKALFAK